MLELIKANVTMPPHTCDDKEVAVPSLRRRASVIDADRVDEPPQDSDRTTDPAKARALAEEAEAEAAAAEAIAAAARARARALKLRRLAEGAEATATGSTAETAQFADATEDVDTTDGIRDRAEERTRHRARHGA